MCKGAISQLRAIRIAVLGLALGQGPALLAQVADPLPPIEKRGLAVEVRELVRLPDSRGLLPADRDAAGRARVSFVIDAPDGRRFANDSRGFLYLLPDGGEPEVYFDLRPEIPHANYSRLESGFIGFAFHPEFARNGLFYTIHGEYAADNPATPDFIPPGYGPEDVTYHNVITEWRADDPAADRFAGSRRELLRVAHVVQNLTHPMGFVGFNPTAAPGDPDYGLLYTSGSDLGFSNGGGPESQNPGQTQRLDTVITAILRIDPRSPAESGGIEGLGDYTIPPGNPFVDEDPASLGEIFAFGFRNAHRLSWDAEDGTMFAADIGMSNIEEINIVHAGANYGWMPREGYWENGIVRAGGSLNELFELPSDILDGSTEGPYTYPVAIYDHDDGNAVTGGFAYHGQIAALRGKFVFGDIRRGRVFAADLDAMKAADDGVPTTVAPIEEIQLYVRDADGERQDVTFQELVEQSLGEEVARTDLQLGQASDGELFLSSRQDGTIRVLVP